jgi:hypothetical protein
MKMFRAVAMAAAAALLKKGLDEARKPENQRRMKEAVEQAKRRRAESKHRL